jgi:hypothetical protein
MRRFSLAVAGYILACLIAIAIIILRGDGPHPRIVVIYPPNGDSYFPGGPAQITFSQAMDHASVERALQVSPGTQGQGAWFGNTLNLQPVGDWQANVTYHVELSGTVTDAEGRPLHTPVSFWFRVHHLRRLTTCSVREVREVCERTNSGLRPIFISPDPVEQYALSDDGSLIAYTRRDRSGLPHLFVINADGTQNAQLTGGRQYADSDPSWNPGDDSTINYYRRRVVWNGGRPVVEEPAQPWSISIDGSDNSPG